MEIIGKIYSIGDPRQGVGSTSGKPWVSQNFELVIKNRGKEEIITLNAWGATCDTLANLRVGQLVQVELIIHGEMYQGRRYNRLEAGFISLV